MALALLGEAGPPDAPSALLAACQEAGIGAEEAPAGLRSPLDKDAAAAAAAAGAAYVVELMSTL